MGPSPGQPIQPPNIQYYGAAVTIAQPTAIRTATVYPLAIQAPPPGAQPPPPGLSVVRAPPPPAHRLQPQQFSQAQLRYLLAAYRVGMLAMETLARRVHDDRPQAKYARNPPYGEDVKWLLRISKHLGEDDSGEVVWWCYKSAIAYCRHPVPPPVLRVRGEQHRQSVCPARRCDGVCPVSVEEQPGSRDAAPTQRPHSSSAEVPADVHTVHASEAVSSHTCRLRGFREHSVCGEGCFPDHARG